MPVSSVTLPLKPLNVQMELICCPFPLSSTVSPISVMFGMKQGEKVQNKQSRFMESSWTMKVERERRGRRSYGICSYSIILKFESLLGGVFLEFWVQWGWQGSFQNLSQHSRWYWAKSENKSEAAKDGIRKWTAFIVTVLKESLPFLVGITTRHVVWTNQTL